MTDYPIKSPRKLIEVALPLDAINVACAREKSIRHGHPSTLHLWWARRPLAAARAVIFSQLVNDPSWKWELEHPGEIAAGHLKASWTASRKRLFAIIEELVKWENTTNEEVLEPAREEIRKSWRETCEVNQDHPQAAELFNPDKLPGLHDPFAGGGTIPLEAQRLGLEAYASDLNPVAVLINKAMIEIPPKFAGRPPVSLAQRRGDAEKKTKKQLLLGASASLREASSWPGAKGLAEDVRYYGRWMRDEAQKRIGHLYPPVEITPEMAADRPDLAPYVGQKLTVIAWLWARTVKSPNPAFSHVDIPLASTFILSSKDGKEAYVEPVIENGGYRFTVKVGKPPTEAKAGTKAARGSNFRCLMSGSPISADYIMTYAKLHGLGARLFAVVAEGSRGRVYLSPDVNVPMPKEMPDLAFLDLAMTNDRRWFSPPLYGMPKWKDLFTSRQLVALTTLSDLLSEARSKIRADSLAAGLTDDGQSLATGGSGASAYAEAVSVYLAFCIDKNTLTNTTLATWQTDPARLTQAFSRQAIPMTWDFAEANPLSRAGGGFIITQEAVIKVLERLPMCIAKGAVTQQDAINSNVSFGFVSTDPPYYDNIGYADLSDYFYVWLRRSLRDVYPELLATIAVPKAEELVATPYRHGTKEKAEKFFLDAMTQVMRNLAEHAHPTAPLTVYYAFKQSEKEGDSTNSTGWETFLEAVHRAGLGLTGTWPMRTELIGSLKKVVNALASSIILVCRPRATDAATISRRQFIRELNTTLPTALDAMTRESEGLHSPVAPVDLSQAIIGPGMAVFSKYSAVLEADGTPMSVHTALQLINRFLAEDDFDADTQFCLHWFEQYGWQTGRFGEADTLARAKGTSVEGVKQAGVLDAAGGSVRLLKWAEYPTDWDPQTDQRLPVWEVLHQLIRVFHTTGETGAGSIFAAVQSKAESARQLAYRLYTLCERAGWAEDARAYNELITSWSAIESAAAHEPAAQQRSLFD
ncbi:MAG: DUF1156 domain-containing protein [Planctomycetota bacterium]|nr:DUF1156 domain-containing protein [Planctomycetota bacterium]